MSGINQGVESAGNVEVMGPYVVLVDTEISQVKIFSLYFLPGICIGSI